MSLVQQQQQQQNVLNRLQKKKKKWDYIIRIECCLLELWWFIPHVGPGSVVAIATAYGLDGPGIESRWGEIFRTSPDRP